MVIFLIVIQVAIFNIVIVIIVNVSSFSGPVVVALMMKILKEMGK